MPSLAYLKKAFPIKLQNDGFHYYLTEPLDIGNLRRNVISTGGERTLILATHPHNKSNYFIKRSLLTGLSSKLRITFGLPRKNAGPDWEVEELINNLNALQKNIDSPRILGFGYRKRLGLINDFEIISEHLGTHTDAATWLSTNPKKKEIQEFARCIQELIMKLHQREAYHLDMWAGNLMLPPDRKTPKLIDFENYQFGRTAYSHELLGFLFGFFFHRELGKHLTSQEYDKITEHTLENHPEIDTGRFARLYEVSKYLKIGRKERREIFHSGTVVTG
ncbi:lipopolysaccharide kinase InaA family protein [Azotobacter salinestris]|uniref:lipopolysaccharide kinase InaA family protein n=1 Tax=Azotobacter salinestris TaxID=69964 RepID=UPI00126692BD|nr:lipopolysaccharide kinase InaA family protein [Azotobacter salinestris]